MNEELPALVASNFPVDTRLQSIFGHSMGGHGALTIAMKVQFFVHLAQERPVGRYVIQILEGPLLVGTAQKSALFLCESHRIFTEFRRNCGKSEM